MAEVVEKKLKEVDAHPEMTEEIRRSTDRFNWQKCADEYISYYLDILNINHDNSFSEDNDKPLVSIITVCRNADKTLAATIENAAQ
jgi:hypothetical protein